MSVSCVLLAAGLGRRFGGDKLSAAIDGIPMGVYAIRLHAKLPYAKRVLVTQADRSALIDAAREPGFTVVYNPVPEEGIASSIRLGLAALGDIAPGDGILFSVCDQPYLTEQTVRRLIDTFEADPRRIVAPAYLGERGNPVIFPAALYGELAALQGERGGGAVIRRHGDALTTVPVQDPRELTDIDTRA